MHKIVIAMGSDDLGVELEYRLNNEFSVIRCFDGNAAAELLEYLSPDILLIDLSLPVLDGISVLKRAKNHLPPLVLATTIYDGDSLIELMQEVNIQRIFKLPCDVQTIIGSIRSLSKEISPSRAQNKFAAKDISAILTELGIASNRIGFRQLVKAISIYAEDPTISMCKELYPLLTDTASIRDGKTAEHTMRSVIKNAWIHRDAAVWGKYFPGHTESYPTNKTFIARIAQEILSK